MILVSTIECSAIVVTTSVDTSKSQNTKSKRFPPRVDAFTFYLDPSLKQQFCNILASGLLHVENRNQETWWTFKSPKRTNRVARCLWSLYSCTKHITFSTSPLCGGLYQLQIKSGSSLVCASNRSLSSTVEEWSSTNCLFWLYAQKTSTPPPVCPVCRSLLAVTV